MNVSTCVGPLRLLSVPPPPPPPVDGSHGGIAGTGIVGISGGKLVSGIRIGVIIGVTICVTFGVMIGVVRGITSVIVLVSITGVIN